MRGVEDYYTLYPSRNLNHDLESSLQPSWVEISNLSRGKLCNHQQQYLITIAWHAVVKTVTRPLDWKTSVSQELEREHV